MFDSVFPRQYSKNRRVTDLPPSVACDHLCERVSSLKLLNAVKRMQAGAFDWLTRRSDI